MAVINENIKVSGAEKQEIKKKSPGTLPLNPTSKGFSAQEIRRRLDEAIVGEENSILSLMEEKLLHVYTELVLRAGDIEQQETLLQQILSGQGEFNVTVSDTRPSIATSGDIWIQTPSFTIYAYYYDGGNGAWFESSSTSPESSSFVTIANLLTAINNHNQSEEAHEDIRTTIAELNVLRLIHVETLPAQGEVNVIYLVPTNEEGPDQFDEYIWLEQEERYEFLGRFSVDLDFDTLVSHKKEDFIINPSENEVEFWFENNNTPFTATDLGLGKVRLFLNDILIIANGEAVEENFGDAGVDFIDFYGTPGEDTTFTIEMELIDMSWFEFVYKTFEGDPANVVFRFEQVEQDNKVVDIIKKTPFSETQKVEIKKLDRTLKEVIEVEVQEGTFMQGTLNLSFKEFKEDCVVYFGETLLWGFGDLAIKTQIENGLRVSHDSETQLFFYTTVGQRMYMYFTQNTPNEIEVTINASLSSQELSLLPSTTIRIEHFKAIDAVVDVLASDWEGTEPTIAVKTVNGLLSTDKPIIDVDLSSVLFSDIEAIQTEYSKIYRVATTDKDEITFYALEVPTEDLTIQIKVVR